MNGRRCRREISLVPKRNIKISDKLKRDDEAKIEILRQAVKEGMDEIDRGEFVVIEPDEIDGFVDQLAAKVLKRNG